MDILNEWIEDLPQQFQGKELIEALISAFSKQLSQIYGVFNQLCLQTDLEAATGKNLDMVGDIVKLTRKEAGMMAGIGVDEPVISDERYRQFLRYKVLLNTNNCTYYDVMQSIELLWHTDNIKYTENPSRPATILIELGTLDVDSKVDPSDGKVMAIKPAGVSLIYTANFWTIIDNSDLEHIYFPKMRLHYKIPFWSYRMLDGTWILDGSCLLDAQRNYGIRPGVKIFGNGLKVRGPDEEFDNFELIKKFRLWYLDGSVLLDGSKTLDPKIEKEEI